MSIKLLIPENEFDKICNMYSNWISVENIAKQYLVSTKAIYNVLKRCNIKMRKCSDRQNSSDYATNKKYNFNENYFEKIDTVDKAYWLGFLFADGNVHFNHSDNGNVKGGTVKIELKREDDYHLRNFVRCLNGDLNVKLATSKCNDKIFETARLDIHSVKMCRDLTVQGCIPNKSLVLESPKNLSEEFIPSFIKGYFDGDGCVGYYPQLKDSKIHVDICGTESFLLWVKNILFKNNIDSMTISKDKRSNVYKLVINGRLNMCNFYNYIYDAATCILGRKKDLFMQALIELSQPLEMSNIANIAQRM